MCQEVSQVFHTFKPISLLGYAIPPISQMEKTRPKMSEGLNPDGLASESVILAAMLMVQKKSRVLFTF